MTGAAHNYVRDEVKAVLAYVDQREAEFEVLYAQWRRTPMWRWLKYRRELDAIWANLNERRAVLGYLADGGPLNGATWLPARRALSVAPGHPADYGNDGGGGL